MAINGITFASEGIVNLNDLPPSERLIRLCSMLLVSDAKLTLGGGKSIRDMVTPVAGFIQAEAQWLDSGGPEMGSTPDAGSAGRFYRAILAFCQEHGFVSNPPARALALDQVFKPILRMLIETHGPAAYRGWVETLSPAGLAACHTRTLADTKLAAANA